MFTVEELNGYTVKQLKILLEYEGKSIPKKAKKAQLIDLLVQLPLPEPESEQPCSVRVQRIKDSQGA